MAAQPRGLLSALGSRAQDTGVSSSGRTFALWDSTCCPPALRFALARGFAGRWLRGGVRVCKRGLRVVCSRDDVSDGIFKSAGRQVGIRLITLRAVSPQWPRRYPYADT